MSKKKYMRYKVIDVGTFHHANGSEGVRLKRTHDGEKELARLLSLGWHVIERDTFHDRGSPEGAESGVLSQNLSILFTLGHKSSSDET